VARRRKYDTEALVGQMRSERRTALILSLAGVFILGFLLTLYVTGIGSEDEVPEVPEVSEVSSSGAGGAAGAGEAAAAGTDGAGGGGGDVPEGDDVADGGVVEEASAPGKVTISLSKKGVLWVDGEKVGKVKGKTLELSPGAHLLKAKVGKKTVEAELEVASGVSYTVAFHHKKKSATISEGGDEAAPAGTKKKKKRKKRRRR